MRKQQPDRYAEDPTIIRISIEGTKLDERFMSGVLSNDAHGTRMIERLDDHTLVVESYTPLRLLDAFRR